MSRAAAAFDEFQLLRFRAWPHTAPGWLTAILLGVGLSATAAADAAWTVAFLLAGATLLPALRLVLDCGSAMAAVRRAVPAARAVEQKPRAERAEGAVEQVA